MKIVIGVLLLVVIVVVVNAVLVKPSASGLAVLQGGLGTNAGSGATKWR